MPLALLLDEDLRDGALWRAITRHNASDPEFPIDDVRVGDAGAPGLGTRDPEVLAWAVAAGRILVSRDVSTLIAEHHAFVTAGGQTPGLLLLRRGYAIPELIEYLSLLCHPAEAREFANRCAFIPVE